MEGKKLISSSEASLILQVDERSVRRYCAEGKLGFQKEGRAYQIELESVLELLKEKTDMEQVADINPDEDFEDEDAADAQDGIQNDVRKPVDNVRTGQSKRKLLNADADIPDSGERTSINNVRKHLDVEKSRADIKQRISDTRFQVGNDVRELADKLRTSIQDVNENAEALVQCLMVESRKNILLQRSLSKLLNQLQIPSDQSSQKRWVWILTVLFLAAAGFSYFAIMVLPGLEF